MDTSCTFFNFKEFVYVDVTTTRHIHVSWLFVPTQDLIVLLPCSLLQPDMTRV